MGTHQVDERGLVVACASCGQRNRVPFSATETRCGRCKASMAVFKNGREVGRTTGARPADDIEALSANAA